MSDGTMTNRSHSMSSIVLLKRCCHCKEDKPATTEYFCRNKQRPDGLHPKCKACKSAYRQTPSGKASFKRHKAREMTVHTIRYKARKSVQNAVHRGKMSRPSDCICIFCGEPAIEYHHPTYAYEHRLDVIPVCKTCHDALSDPQSRLRQLGYF